jgi:NodT family efflux transporter outer membrane factor (OMF) lipoprotein
MTRLGAAPLSVLLLLGACTAGPTYTPPHIAMPSAYGSAQPQVASTADFGKWWMAFGDPMLDSLIMRALTDNLDVQQAAARVRQARAQELATRRSGGPQANASAQGGYTRLSENSLPAGLANLGGANPGTLNPGQSSGSGLGFPGEGFATFQTGFDASWEIDLFGGQRRANEAARARTEAAVWSRRDAEVMLVAEVANTYQQYRALQRRIAIADETLASERELLDFVKVRTAKGLVTTLDERRQQRDVEAVAAQRADLAAQADARLHALATLLGLAPMALSVELAATPSVTPAGIAIPVGLPSDLLQRRPDIRAAERRLAAATADIGVAAADLYPRFSLTGALQLASRSLSNLLESDSILANGAGRLSLPLLGRGTGKATVHLREAQADEALLAYQADVLTALRDVEDALTRIDADRQGIDHQRISAQAAEDAADTAAVRYRHGLTPYLDVLEARQVLLSARDTLAQAEAAAVQDQVALYKALGGGWDERRMMTEKDETDGRGK